MRSLWIIFSVSVVLFLTSCEKSAKPLYEVRLDANFEIPATLPANPVIRHYFILKDVPVFYTQNAAAKLVDTSKITAAYPSFGSIRSRFGDEDLSCIQDVIVRVIGENGAKIEIYRNDFVEYNVRNEVRMLSQTFDGFKEYLQNETIDIEIGIRLRYFPVRNISAVLDFGYAVFE